ncbi:NAD-dependent protein deacetylase sirtuin-2-like [Patiria miniata]|uniref:NAD-dependent protein deacetylase n=1 Tax=Patiria miniata TaxID=46514 RepID=A0A914BNP9_PATMI|nr:NAD-dependent protein deacetylase sirtuin-2-like [Patiria miniata]XP_038077757.1 NAD-dependent protein deacetylase sirtuin-2-like [Patiria miniata]XP_038077758.1 NAD-dependent protein deacetylase sirtuin-2-like [Patiria miniata]XP_038077759.1 NAD-dependent protein deacetylase sirtuin-2-like [Patiria miniata]
MKMSDLDELTQRFSSQSSAEKFEAADTPQQVLDEISLEGVARYIQSGNCKNVIFMTGAGISTSAGLPDFRTKTTGLYDQLEEYELPNPQRMFEIRYFMERPEPFFKLVKSLYPGDYKPTPCHYFIRLMSEKNVVLRNYTQNIDTLDKIAGMKDELIVEAHGGFSTAHCIGKECYTEYGQKWVRDEIFADRIPKCNNCGAIIKPDCAFFGEDMPKGFDKLVEEDFPKCDLLIVSGTSLMVQPFAAMINKVPATTPRLLINYELSGKIDPLMKFMGTSVGFNFDYADNYRDVFYLGSCDDGFYKLAELLGWKDELVQLIKTEHQKLDAAASSN